MKYLIWLLIFGLGFLWYFKVRPMQGEAKKKRASPAKKLAASTESDAHQKKYHGIAIIYEDNGCAAVKALYGKRFLSDDAPPLPLPGCDASHCNCRYEHFADRREGDNDRRSRFSLQSETHIATGKEDRRAEKRGRRKKDKE